MLASSRTLVIVVHALATSFWALIGAMAGERSSFVSAVFFGGSVVVVAGIVLLLKRHRRARTLLVIGDLVPVVVGAAFAAWIAQAAIRESSLMNVLVELGPSLALFVPAAVGPLLLALNLPRSTPAR